MKMTVVLALVCVTFGLAVAQDSDAAVKRYELDIPQQTLDAALKDLAQQTGLQIARFTDNGHGSSMVGPVRGDVTAETALDSLLARTGLEYSFINERTVAVASVQKVAEEGGDSDSGNARPAPILMAQNQAAVNAQDVSERAGAAKGQETVHEIPEITVFGRGETATMREVPQTADVFEGDFVENIEADTVIDVLRFVPNASTSTTHPALHDGATTIRGFSSSTTWNGMARHNYNGAPDMANVQRIEVLKGPASVLYGTMEPGAVVNIVTKQPRDVLHGEVSLRFGSYNDGLSRLDVGGPLSDRVRVRLNASYQQTDTHWDNSGMERIFFSPVAQIDLSPTTLMTIEGYYSRQHWPDGWTDGRIPGGLTGNPLLDLPTSTNFGYDEGIAGSGGYGDLDETRETAVGNIRIRHDISAAVSLNAALTYSRNFRYEESIFTGALSADNRTLARSYWIADDNPSHDRIYHLDLAGETATGPLMHKWILGVDYTDSYGHGNTAFFGITPIDVFAPVFGTVVLPDSLPFRRSESNTDIAEVFLQDRVSIGNLHFVGGVRYSDYHLETETMPFGGTPSTSGIDDKIWSTQFGVLYDIGDWVTLFASRNESFVPQIGTTLGGGATVPETGIQYEVGSKFDIGDTGLFANVAYFDIEKNDVFISDPNNPLFLIPVGQLVSEGFELSVQGRPLPGLSVYAGFGYNDTEITRANANVGNQFRLAPKNTFSVQSSYTFQSGAVQGLQVNGSVQHVGERFGSPANVTQYPAYTRVDVGGSYPISERADVSLFVRNLTETEMYAGFGTFLLLRDFERSYFAEVTLRY